MDQLTNLEIADVQNRWHEAGRPGLGSLRDDGLFTTYVTNPIDYAATYYGILQPPPTPPKPFTPVAVDLSKPEPTDRVAVTPGTINTAYLYLPGSDPESVAETKKMIEERKSVYDILSWPKSLQPGSKESMNLMDEYYKALAAQQASGKATPTSSAPGPGGTQKTQTQTSGKKSGDWQQYVPWGVVGVLGLVVLVVALRR